MAKKRQPIKIPALPKKKGRPFKPPAPKVPRTLTAKEQRFVEEYCVDLNATQSAIRAGYSKKSAHDIGYENLKKPEIQAAVSKFKADLAARAIRTKADIERELEKMGFANLANYHRIGENGDPIIDLSDCTREDLAALTELETHDYIEGRGEDARDVRKVRLKMADKRQALMDLAKLRGQVEDKSTVRHEDATSAAVAAEMRGKSAERLRLEVEVYYKLVLLDDAKLSALGASL